MPPRNATQRPTRPRAQRSKPPPAKAGTITFMGESYRVNKTVGIWPLMQFARAAESGLDTGSHRGLAAIHAFLEDIIHPDDWGRFQEDMIKKKMNNLDGLLDTVQEAVSAALERAAGGSNGRAKAEIVEKSDETG